MDLNPLPDQKQACKMLRMQDVQYANKSSEMLMEEYGDGRYELTVGQRDNSWL